MDTEAIQSLGAGLLIRANACGCRLWLRTTTDTRTLSHAYTHTLTHTENHNPLTHTIVHHVRVNGRQFISNILLIIICMSLAEPTSRIRNVVFLLRHFNLMLFIVLTAHIHFIKNHAICCGCFCFYVSPIVGSCSPVALRIIFYSLAVLNTVHCECSLNFRYGRYISFYFRHFENMLI